MRTCPNPVPTALLALLLVALVAGCGGAPAVPATPVAPSPVLASSQVPDSATTPATTSPPATSAAAAQSTLTLPLTLGFVTQRAGKLDLQIFPIGRTTVLPSQTLLALSDVYTIEVVLSELPTDTFQLFYNQDGRLAGADTPASWKALAISTTLSMDPQGVLSADAPGTLQAVMDKPISAVHPFDQRPFSSLLHVSDVIRLIQSDHAIKPLLAVHMPANSEGAGQLYELLIVFDDLSSPAPGDAFRAWCAQCVEGLCTYICPPSS